MIKSLARARKRKSASCSTGITGTRVEDAIGPVRDKRYHETVCKHYLAFYRRNIAADVVFPDSDFGGYSVLVAPMLYMLKPGFAEEN